MARRLLAALLLFLDGSGIARAAADACAASDAFVAEGRALYV